MKKQILTAAAVAALFAAAPAAFAQQVNTLNQDLKITDVNTDTKRAAQLNTTNTQVNVNSQAIANQSFSLGKAQDSLGGTSGADAAFGTDKDGNSLTVSQAVKALEKRVFGSQTVPADALQ